MLVMRLMPDFGPTKIMASVILSYKQIKKPDLINFTQTYGTYNVLTNIKRSNIQVSKISLTGSPSFVRQRSSKGV